ncbi:hypothetical protein [Brachybacterium paraconglomeratum]|uniref:hypothetical protein n=1 Tax=Brachybacterium paraconglomeratum TaxID=173362 RepID=UPI0022AEB467|nr:hypothetical protein [Brachybacterium paraconglomeratum]MCZ4326761.1 hypothetical protein [Brachybacterium paraconglomeratum]
MAAEEELKPYNLFTLTHLIGKKATQARTTVVFTAEMGYVTAIWYFVSLALSILLALVLGFTFMGTYAIIVPIFLPFIVTAFATVRSRSGLQLTHLQRTMDHLDRPWARGYLVYAGRLYDPLAVRLVTVTPASVEVEALPDYEPPEALEVFGIEGENPRRDAQLIAREGGRSLIRSARGAAARTAQVRTAMSDVVREEERTQWAKNWEAQERHRREQLLVDLGVSDPPEPTASESAPATTDEAKAQREEAVA